jgi:S-(hydroxymethyl)glutathione dehydrogenase/alcohol dehydrogenase
VMAVDVLDSKLQSAKAFGATHTVNASDKDAIGQVQALTGGRGSDYVFVTVGSVAAIRQGYNMSGPRGMVVVVGLSPRGEQLTVPPFFGGERILTSSNMGSTNLALEIPKLVDLYKAGKLKLDELITKHYKLDQINT